MLALAPLEEGRSRWIQNFGDNYTSLLMSVCSYQQDYPEIEVDEHKGTELLAYLQL